MATLTDREVALLTAAGRSAALAAADETSPADESRRLMKAASRLLEAAGSPEDANGALAVLAKLDAWEEPYGPEFVIAYSAVKERCGLRPIALARLLEKRG